MFSLESKRLGSTGQYVSYFHNDLLSPALDVPPDRVRDSDESLHDLSGRDYRWAEENTISEIYPESQNNIWN